MCRNIKPLFNFEPAATDEEIRIAALQFIRKITGYNKPSKINTTPFNKGVEEVIGVVTNLFDNLETKAKPKNREIEGEKAKVRFDKRLQKLREG
jgi:hypothetical protein